jgi:hypothetical protein
MTLQEKFKQWLDTDPRVQIRDVQLEIIAEEFAIGFGEYLDSLTTEDMGTLSIKELLEIYKETL